MSSPRPWLFYISFRSSVLDSDHRLLRRPKRYADALRSAFLILLCIRHSDITAPPDFEHCCWSDWTNSIRDWQHLRGEMLKLAAESWRAAAKTVETRRTFYHLDRQISEINFVWLSLTHLPLHHRLILKTLHSQASEDDDEDSKNLLETEIISLTWSEDSRIPVLHRTDLLLLTGMREEIGKKKCAASAAAILDKNGFQLCSWCIMES